MNRQDLINTCVFEQFQGLLFSDLSGPLIFCRMMNVKTEKSLQPGSSSAVLAMLAPVS